MKLFSQYRLTTCRFALALTLGGFFVPGEAQAGFEWNPPPAARHENTGPAVSAVPVPEVSITPAPSASGAGDVHIDMQPFTAPVTAEPLAAEEAPAPQTEDRAYAMAEGFGRDIPLALVMQQVVPAGYAYSFDPGINPGMRVSWDGGKPWNRVLADAVKPFHLDVVVSDMTVWLRPATETAIAAAEPVADTPVAEAKTVEPYVSRMREIENIGYEKIEMSGSDAPQKLVTDPAQLAAIGRNDAGYRPSYPRRMPLPASVAAAPPPPDASAAPQLISPPHMAAPQDNNPFAETAAPVAPVKVPQPQMLSYEHKAAPMEEIIPAAPHGEAPAVLDPFEIRFWQAEKEASLKDTLSQWTAMSGVKMYWGAGSDYRLPKAVRLHGTFPDAVTAILSAYGDGADRPLGRLHPNLPDGPSVLIIQSSGSEKAVN